MKYLIGVLVGLVWGACGAVLNAAVSRRFIAKQNVSLLMAGNMLRILVDITALGACFLLRNSEIISFYTAIVGTAASLSLISIVFAFKMAKSDTDTKTQTNAGEGEIDK